MALQFVFVLVVVAKSVLATNCPSSCPNLNIASGSQPITQAMTTNQYNCTSPHIKCVNPNGGSVYFVFYNNGSQSAALGSSNGTIDTQVICSTENYLWVFVNNGSSTARIDTVSCIYGSSSANTTKAPSTAAPTASNYTCPTLNVASGSQPINQTMTINQYNRTSPHIKCVNPNGGSVYLVFYNNGSQVAALGSSNGTIDTQVICSTENYLWVFVNNGSSTARIDTVSCIYGSSSANTTKAPSTAAPTTSNYTCPTLNIASGSQPINQTMTINQYNRTSPHIKCVNPNGGSVYLVFYNNGSQVAALGSSNGTIDTQVICSTENYLWVFVNNGSSTARIDTVSCIYGSSSANTTKAPSPAATTAYNYIAACNSCPKTLAVNSGSLAISQTTGTNQYNCSVVNLYCPSSNGGNVSFKVFIQTKSEYIFKFYYNGTQVASVSGNGAVFDAVNCSTEKYQWITVNGAGVKVSSVTCSSP